MYTDGVTEAMDRDGQLYGLERLHTVLRADRRMSAQDICDSAWDAVRTYSGAAAPRDDVTLVAVRVE